MALDEAKKVLQLVKEEAYFICVFMATRDTRHFLTLAHDEDMINGEYIFLGNEIPSNPNQLEVTYRADLKNVILYEGFITIRPKTPSGPAWNQLQEDVIEAFSDPRFDGQEHTDNPSDVHIYAG